MAKHDDDDVNEDVDHFVDDVFFDEINFIDFIHWSIDWKIQFLLIYVEKTKPKINFLIFFSIFL